MQDQFKNIDPYFFQLVLSLQAASWQQMGKTTSPLTGKIERDLQMAQNSIDMLSMIEEKTKGNLSEEEDKLLGHILYELRLNFVEETKKEAQSEEKPETENLEKSDDKKDDSSGAEK